MKQGKSEVKRKIDPHFLQANFFRNISSFPNIQGEQNFFSGRGAGGCDGVLTRHRSLVVGEVGGGGGGGGCKHVMYASVLV